MSELRGQASTAAGRASRPHGCEGSGAHGFLRRASERLLVLSSGCASSRLRPAGSAWLKVWRCVPIPFDTTDHVVVWIRVSRVCGAIRRCVVVDEFPYHVGVGGVMEAHADSIGEARMVAAYLVGRAGRFGVCVTITCTDGIGYRLIERACDHCTCVGHSVAICCRCGGDRRVES